MKEEGRKRNGTKERNMKERGKENAERRERK